MPVVPADCLLRRLNANIGLHELSRKQAMHNYLTIFLSTEALDSGALLSSNDPRYSCVVQDDGSLELTNWPVRLRTLHQATRAAQQLALYGTDIGAKNFRTANPLFYWSYFDSVTNQQEKLQRLWQLTQSSFQSSSGYCPICIESANAGTDAISREDTITLSEYGPERTIVAPRHHFTEIERIPARDARKLRAAVLAEVQLYLGTPGVVTIKTIHTESGHAAYEVRHAPNANATL